MLAYDAARHALVLYGGRRERTALRDTWELTAGGWSRKDSAGPTPEPHGVMAFDPSTHNVLLYHTVGDDGPERGTWGWNGQQWRRLASEPNAVIPDAMFGALGAHH